MKIIFRGKEYQTLAACYRDNKDIAKVSLPIFVNRIKKGLPAEEAITFLKNKTLQTTLGSHIVEGVEYPNLPSVARAYGIKEMTMYKRHHRGFRGDDLVPLKKRKNYVPPEPKPSVWQVEIGGVKYKSITAALKALGVKRYTYYNRRWRNYPFEQCIGFEPFADRRVTRSRTFNYKGEQLTFRDIEDRFNVYTSTFLRRLKKGLSIEEALNKKSRKKLEADKSHLKKRKKKS